MKVGIMQPYFMPYIGYWQLMKAVDRYVIFDDVNFIKRGWANRNNILNNGQKYMFSIALRAASQNKHFNEIYVLDDFVKFRKTLEFCYKKAPYYNSVLPLMDEIFSFEDKCLSHFIRNSFEVVLNYLNIQTTLLYSSDIRKEESKKGQDKIMDICLVLGATQYINASGGQELYDKEKFALNGMSLSFLQPEVSQYKQFENEFVPSLSIIDVMMFNSSEEVNKMLDNYKLI